MEIIEIQEYSEDVLAALNELMPQLSASFSPLSETDLRAIVESDACLLYTSPSPRDATLSRMPSSA